MDPKSAANTVRGLLMEIKQPGPDDAPEAIIVSYWDCLALRTLVEFADPSKEKDHG